ncbi:MAG TPA: hypothetical protein V6C58_00560, partial [Allocoleopsis sp.]
MPTKKTVKKKSTKSVRRNVNNSYNRNQKQSVVVKVNTPNDNKRQYPYGPTVINSTPHIGQSDYAMNHYLLNRMNELNDRVGEVMSSYKNPGAFVHAMGNTHYTPLHHPINNSLASNTSIRESPTPSHISATSYKSSLSNPDADPQLFKYYEDEIDNTNDFGTNTDVIDKNDFGTNTDIIDKNDFGTNTDNKINLESNIRDYKKGYQKGYEIGFNKADITNKKNTLVNSINDYNKYRNNLNENLGMQAENYKGALVS